jgi:exonuclease SbcC
MFLKRLFRKPTDGPDDDQQSLDAAAIGEFDTAARREACRRLVNLTTLGQLAAEDTDASVRDLAAARYRRLLCGHDPQSPPLAERLPTIADCPDPSILAAAARDAAEPELRRAAIDRVTDQAALADCAVNDPLAANRVAAAERVTDKTLLEQLVKRIGKRDKNVYRSVRQRLKAIAEQEERPRWVHHQAAGICERLERLGRFENWVQDRAVLSHLEQQWAEVEAEVDADAKARYETLRDAFMAGYETYADQNAALIAEHEAREAALATKEGLIERVDEIARLDKIDDVTAGLARAETIWGEAGDAGPPHEARLEREYRRVLARAREHQSRLQAEAERAKAAARLLADTEAALKRGETSLKTLKRLEARLARLHEGDAGCAEAIDRLRHRVEKHRNQLARKLAGLADRLRELDAHFERGELRKAEPIYQSIVATLDHARTAELPAKDVRPIEDHLKAIAPQLTELKRWRRWSADQHREELCAAAEALIDDERPLEPLTNRLHELQAAWRGLDRGGPPAKDPLWRRFQAATAQVRDRCRPYLDQQAAVRDANRKAREAICQRLEDFLEQVDWERIDWKLAARAERETRQSWAAIGPLEGREHRSLEGRFRKALRRLDKALAEERERNQAQKHDLIEQMKALAEEPDLDRAIESAKSLQRQWHTTVPARQRDENALWKAFRAAADAVFARRAAQHQARHAEMADNQATREAICSELSELAATATTAETLNQTLRELETRWRNTEALPVHRDAVAGLDRRWREARAAALKRHEELTEARRWEAIARIEARADLCDRTARTLAAGNDVDAERLRQDWIHLPNPQDAAIAERLDGIFTALLETQGDPARERLREQMANNLARREELCLHLEIVTGVESPPEHQSRRLQLQVERLNEHMGEGEADPLGDSNRLLLDYYLATPAATSDALVLRFARARRALGASAPTSAAA